jgi:hypothetical protein
MLRTSALLPSTVTAMPAKAAACRPETLWLTQAMRHLKRAASNCSIAWSRKILPGGNSASGIGFSLWAVDCSPVIQTSCSCRTTCPPVKSFMRVTSAISTSPRLTHPTSGVDSEQFSSSWTRGKALRNIFRIAGSMKAA